MIPQSRERARPHEIIRGNARAQESIAPSMSWQGEISRLKSEKALPSRPEGDEVHGDTF